MLRTILSLSLVATLAAGTLMAQTVTTPAKTQVKKPVTTTKSTKMYPKLPHKMGWVQVEEFVLWPLHKEAHFALKASAESFRKGEEKKAAAEIHKAIAWLRITESHATTEGKHQLSEAIGKLSTIAADLDKGSVVAADKVSHGISRACYAIANEHYLKAKANHTGTTADRDSNQGAKHLIAAGLYLQEAARSANHQFGKDVDSSLKSMNVPSKSESEKAEYDGILANYLKAVGDGLQQLGAELQQP